MITTTYTCDRCNHSQENSLQMWEVCLFVVSYPIRPNVYLPTNLPQDKQLWCRRCIDKLQLLGYHLAEKKEPPIPEVTFEDKIREIVEESVDIAVGNAIDKYT